MLIEFTFIIKNANIFLFRRFVLTWDLTFQMKNMKVIIFYAYFISKESIFIKNDKI